MLPNYDAGAVAGIMGIGFLRSVVDASPAPRKPVARFRATVAASGDITVVDDHGSLIRIIECRTDPVHARHGKGRGRHAPHVATGAVSPPSPILIEKAVETGLPRQALRHVAEWLAGGDETKVARFEWGVVPKTTLERRTTQLSPEESERTERVARLAVHAQRALGTAAEAREFMTTPHPRLDGRTPLEAARTDLGTRRVESVLNALEYGLAL